jgi:iron complex outermembrane receptor protein
MIGHHACARSRLPKFRANWWLGALVCGALMHSTSQGFAAPGAAALSITELKRMSVEELLNQEVMSVSRKPERWRKAASNIFLIRGQGAMAAGATTLPQVLRLAPTLFVAQSSSSHWAVNTRGFVRTNGYSNKLLVLIDGRTVYSPLFSNVFWDSQDVFVPDIERVEVISGPSGSTWGANAVNGVINILSKTAHETQGGVFYAEAGSETKRHFGVRYGGRFGKTGAFRVYAKDAAYDATLDARGADDDYDPWHFSQTGFRADWGVPQQSAWTFQGDAFRGVYENGANPETRNDGANALLRLTRHVTPDSAITARLYHDYTMRNTQGAINEHSRATDLEVQHRFVFGEHQEVIWGGNYRMMRDHITDTVGFVVLPAHLSFEQGAVFVQHQLGIREDSLRVISGYRADYNHFSGWEHQPSFRVAWDVRREQTLWMAASRTTRTPSRLDTGFYAPEQPPYFIGGGPGFVSEVLHAYELGWRAQLTKNASLTTSLFFHDYDELRSVEPTTPIVVANGVEGRSFGGEIFADWDVAPWWRLRFGYVRTEQETRLTAGSADIERGLGESSYPAHKVQLRNVFQLTRSITLWTSLRNVGAVPAFENGVKGRVPSYTELDLRLAWALKGNVELAVIGRNLLDRSHPEIGADATRREIERNVQATLKWAF